MKSRLLALAENVRTGFWAVPTLFVLAAIGLSYALVAFDRSLQEGFGRVTFGAGADGAREVLSAITTSMITFTGLVFSITIVVLQLTSSQFSPRVLRTFLRDRQTQVSLGAFIATFVYAVLVLRTVSGLDDDTFVPAVSTTVGVVLLLVTVGVFVAYIHHIATAIQVSSILHSITAETRQVLERQLPTDAPPTPVVVPPRSTPVAVLPAPEAGVVITVDRSRLVQLASEADVVLSTHLAIGGFVPEGAPLLEVHGGDAGRLDTKAVQRCFGIGKVRTMQDDVAFGFRQLADIAAKALSPGVNDPTTAVQALDGLHDLLRRIATRHLPTGAHSDEEGRIRLYLPAPRLEDFLALGLDEAAQYGTDSVQVRERLEALVADLLSAALPEHRPAVESWLARHEEVKPVAAGRRMTA